MGGLSCACGGARLGRPAMIDTHAHLNDPKFEHDLDSVIKRASDAGVGAVVVCGYDLPSSVQAVEIAERYTLCLAAVGVHPHDSRHLSPADLARLRELSSNPRVIAIGETGLDFHYDFSPRADQIAAFEKHLELAQEAGLPVIIHSRESHAETVAVVRATGHPHRGVFHCFSGSPAQAEEVLEMGFFIGVDGPLTYRNSQTLREVAASCPLDRLLIETDCPYLSPVPHRGKRNEPAYLRFVCEAAANAKNIGFEEAALATSSNARRLFERLA